MFLQYKYDCVPLLLLVLLSKSFIQAAALTTQETASPSCEGVKMRMQTGVKHSGEFITTTVFVTIQKTCAKVIKDEGVLLSFW